MPKKVIIIGAGIAGLSAGCYARMNGYEAEIYEAHTTPGGLCTAWKRRGYTFDGCLHWPTGSSPADNFHQLWLELGAIVGRKFFDHDVFLRITGSDGRTLVLYTNVDRLEAHMKELSPADEEPITQLCRYIRRFAKFKTPVEKAFELFGPFDMAGLMFQLAPYMKAMKFLTDTSIKEFASRFKSPLLREGLSLILPDPEMSLMSVVFTLSLLHNRAGGFPQGGSLEFARSIERRFIELGGTVRYQARVEKILVDQGRAAGIRLADGSEAGADFVISAADMRATIFDMLGGKYLEPQHEELLATGRLFPSMVQVSLGVNTDLSSEPECSGEIYRLDKPMMFGHESTDWIMFKNYSFDPSLAPIGKSVVECGMMVRDFAYWEKLAKDPRAYDAEKKRIAAAVSDELERRVPGIKSKIEVIDVATPVTYVRYTGNWKGTYMTWVQTPLNSTKLRLIKKSLPGLANFWLAGMWTMSPGGVPAAAKAARDVVEIICRQDRKRFRTTPPGLPGRETANASA